MSGPIITAQIIAALGTGRSVPNYGPPSSGERFLRQKLLESLGAILNEDRQTYNFPDGRELTVESCIFGPIQDLTAPKE